MATTNLVKALAGIGILAAGAVGGQTVAPAALEKLLGATCGAKVEQVEQLLPGGAKLRRVSVQQARDIAGKLCAEGGPAGGEGVGIGADLMITVLTPVPKAAPPLVGTPVRRPQ